jgi:hypothetical protein
VQELEEENRIAQERLVQVKTYNITCGKFPQNNTRFTFNIFFSFLCPLWLLAEVFTPFVTP